MSFVGNPWRVSSRPQIARGTRSELVAKAAAAQIIENLAAQCALIDDDCVPRDQDWAQIVRRPYRRIKINVPVIPDGIFLGAQPSLVEGTDERFDRWPAITVRCNDLKPTQDLGQPDHYESFDASLIIEVLATAGLFRQNPADDRALSDEIDMQYQRLSDAVLSCIEIDKTLSGTIPYLQRPPIMTPSLPFTKRQSKGAGMWSLYQGMQLEWTVTLLTL